MHIILLVEILNGLLTYESIDDNKAAVIGLPACDGGWVSPIGDVWARVRQDAQEWGQIYKRASLKLQDGVSPLLNSISESLGEDRVRQLRCILDDASLDWTNIADLSDHVKRSAPSGKNPLSPLNFFNNFSNFQQPYTYFQSYCFTQPSIRRLITYDTMKLSILTLAAVVVAVMAAPLVEASQQMEKRQTQVCLLRPGTVRDTCWSSSLMLLGWN